MNDHPNPSRPSQPVPLDEQRPVLAHEQPSDSVPEINGPRGAEPTRFGDWERKGRCIDF